MQVKNWNKFQHFKDRRPPWIKLYRDILDDVNWHELDPVAAKALVMLWVIASEDGGKLPDNKTIAFRLRLPEKTTVQLLNKLSHWLEQDDIGVISERYQADTPETETETEGEKEKEVRDIALYPPEVPDSLWVDFLKLRKAKKAPWSQAALNGFKREAANAGFTLEQAIRTTCERGWQSFKAEWVLNKPAGKGGAPAAPMAAKNYSEGVSEDGRLH